MDAPSRRDKFYDPGIQGAGDAFFRCNGFADPGIRGLASAQLAYFVDALVCDLLDALCSCIRLCIILRIRGVVSLFIRKN